MTEKVAAIVVTHNRIELLKECINALRGQTRAVDEVIIINNASTDGTASWLDSQSDLVVVHQDNQGGAGGFCTGMITAHQRNNDWFWCMDDDTIPHADALEKLLEADKKLNGKVGFLSSIILWKNGELYKNGGIKYEKRYKNKYNFSRWLAQYGCVEVELGSFVSLLVRSAIVEKVGLPYRQFYIWQDDLEFTLRIFNICKYPCFCVLGSKVEHRTKQNGTQSRLYNCTKQNQKKFFCGLRNKMVFLRSRKVTLFWCVGTLGYTFLIRTAQIIRYRLSPKLILGMIYGCFWRPKKEWLCRSEKKHI